MKHLKTYEQNIFLYETGDYVLLDIDKLSKEDYTTDDGLARIVDISKRTTWFPYLVEFDNNCSIYIEEDKIIRLLTPKEIEDFKIKQALNKYNL
jgi:hypothetical protein